MEMANCYLAVGSLANWRSAFSKGNVWGLPENRYRIWSGLKPKDLIFFYVEIPVRAVVGYGELLSKAFDSKPFFAEDWRSESDWPYRITFHICWPSGDPLTVGRVFMNDLNVTLHRGFQKLSLKNGQELLRRCVPGVGT